MVSRPTSPTASRLGFARSCLIFRQAGRLQRRGTALCRYCCSLARSLAFPPMLRTSELQGTLSFFSSHVSRASSPPCDGGCWTFTPFFTYLLTFPGDKSFIAFSNHRRQLSRQDLECMSFSYFLCTMFSFPLFPVVCRYTVPLSDALVPLPPALPHTSASHSPPPPPMPAYPFL